MRILMKMRNGEERIMSLIEGSFASLFTTDQEPRTKTQEPKKHQEIIIDNQILQVGCIYFKLNTCIFFPANWQDCFLES